MKFSTENQVLAQFNQTSLTDVVLQLQAVEALREAGLASPVQPARYTGRDLAEAIAAALGPR